MGGGSYMSTNSLNGAALLHNTMGKIGFYGVSPCQGITSK